MRGGNGRGQLAPSQEHVPVALVRDGLLVSRSIVPARATPYRIIARVLRIGVVEVTRMTESDRADFLARYAAVLSRWRFAYQIVVAREEQDLTGFYRRLRGRAQQARRREREVIAGLEAWMQRVTERVNPQVPAYYVAVPNPTPAMEGPAYEKAVQKLDERVRHMVNSLAMLGIPASAVEDRELMRLLRELYHPRLPNLDVSPRALVLSLMAEIGDPSQEQEETL